MKLKKLVSIMLAGSMVLSMTACGGNAPESDAGVSDTAAETGSEGNASDAPAGSETGGSKALQPFDETVTIKMGMVWIRIPSLMKARRWRTVVLSNG